MRYHYFMLEFNFIQVSKTGSQVLYYISQDVFIWCFICFMQFIPQIMHMNLLCFIEVWKWTSILTHILLGMRLLACVGIKVIAYE